VTLIEPDAAMLVTTALLGALASVVKDAVKLFTCQPVVRIVRRCAHVLAGVLATIELCERHNVIPD
jgi:hypothetical protein